MQPGAFAHRFAEQAGQGQPALAGHRSGFDEKDFAADRRPRQPGSDARHSRPVGKLAEEARRPEQLGNLFGVDRCWLLAPLGAAPGHLAADRGNLALEIAQPGFAGVVADDLADCRIANSQVRLEKSVLIELLGDDVLLRDMRLLFLAVAGKL